MAKTKTTGLVKRTPMAMRADNALGMVARRNAALELATDVALKSANAARKVASQTTEGLTKLYEKAKDKESRFHVATVDSAGAFGALVSFEGVNYLLRRMEKDWPGFAENSDLWQSIPHLVLGVATYFGELLTRKPDAKGLKIFPSMPREIASEWGKAMALLGGSNLWRALRVRRRDAKTALAQKAELEAEVAQLKEKLAALEPGQSEPNQSGGSNG